MPISFYIVIVTIIFLFIYKNLPNIKINSTILTALFLMLFLGFFVKEINLLDVVFINIIFLSATVFLLAEFIFKNKPTKTTIALTASLAVLLIYFTITKINTDYLSFLNYVPINFIVVLGSLFFVKHLQTGLIYILFSFIWVEILNYIMYTNSIGILQLFSVEFINAVIISLIVFYFASLAFNYLIKRKNESSIKNKKGVIYDEK